MKSTLLLWEPELLPGDESTVVDLVMAVGVSLGDLKKVYLANHDDPGGIVGGIETFTIIDGSIHLILKHNESTTSGKYFSVMPSFFRRILVGEYIWIDRRITGVKRVIADIPTVGRRQQQFGGPDGK